MKKNLEKKNHFDQKKNFKANEHLHGRMRRSEVRSHQFFSEDDDLANLRMWRMAILGSKVSLAIYRMPVNLIKIQLSLIRVIYELNVAASLNNPS